MVFHCPVCGAYKSFTVGDSPFEEDDLGDIDDLLNIQEVGGKRKTGRGIGRGQAKGKVETKDSYDISGIPSDHDYIVDELKDRISEVENDLP